MNKFLYLFVLTLVFSPTASYAQVGAAILEGVAKGLFAPKPAKSNEVVLDAKELFPQVSRVELRVIQTRKFKKSPNEVFSAIKSLCADRSGLFVGALPVYRGMGKPLDHNKKAGDNATVDIIYEKYDRTDFGPLACIRRTTIGGGQFMINTRPHEIYKYTVIKYELEWDPADKTETIVRMRINWSRIDDVGSGGTEQTTYLPFYQANFKELADGLFIDAIQLTPAEIQ